MSAPVLPDGVLQGGHIVTLQRHAARRVIAAWESGEAEELAAAIALLADVNPDVPEDFDPRPFIEGNEWVFAKTMPENPHEYVLLRNSSDWVEQLRFLRWLRRGEVERFLGRSYRGRTVDGWRYWALSPDDSIVNRRRQQVHGAASVPLW